MEAINRKTPASFAKSWGICCCRLFFTVNWPGKRDFSLWQVIDGLTRKIYRRHPHVFGDTQISDATGVKVKWEEIKQQEKARKN